MPEFLSLLFLLETATAEDYRLLEDMNRLTSKKYEDMKHVASEIASAMKNLDEKCKEGVMQKDGRGKWWRAWN